MEEMLARVWENLSDRITGPMWLRLVLQPAVAAFFAIRDGLEDAGAGRPAYVSKVITMTGHRRDLIRHGWASIAKVFAMAMIMDTVYQLIVERWVYPLEIVIVAFLLAVVPYILIRGPLNRIVRRFVRPEKTSQEND